ncbi:hypothetical protein AALO_G00257910 [Alosa alosa]|uniref:Uncharacterized protein n=1 Tax=Alosa alosa TaxID=278164 RepID=A0AAV6FWM1_9TELE|nr:hypothetical protein AALO_G00257910 [Alosa alosa]
MVESIQQNHHEKTQRKSTDAVTITKQHFQAGHTISSFLYTFSLPQHSPQKATFLLIGLWDFLVLLFQHATTLSDR